MIKHDLIRQNLKNLKKTSWYHQRFDGCPQFLGIASFPHFFKEKRKFKGGEFTDLLVIYTQGTGDWHINMADIERVARLFIRQSYRESRLSQRLMAKWQVDKKEFYQMCQKLEDVIAGGDRGLRAMTNSELVKLYQKFTKKYQKWFSMTSLIDGFALGTDEFINQKVNEHLEKRGVRRGRGKIFATLTAPTEVSFVNEAEISLLKIARVIVKILALKRVFLRGPAGDIKSNLLTCPKIQQRLKQHQQNYFWLKNNYIHHQVLKVDDFILDIRQWLKGRVEVDKRLRQTVLQPSINKQQKAKLLRQYRLPKFIKNLLEISEDFTVWQDERKKSTLFATHYICLMFREIARRTNYTVRELKFFMPVEVVNLLGGRGYYPSKKQAQQRIKYSVFYYRDKYYECLTGKQARRLVKSLLAPAPGEEVNDFRGMTACPGRVQGRVKIVKSVKQVGKIKEGEILVAVMTRPDYMPGIKKAAAIVTDEGGVTCHAAIVSREFGIPCVIGTKIASKVLKDGDLIEVNANHGVITTLRRYGSETSTYPRF